MKRDNILNRLNFLYPHLLWSDIRNKIEPADIPKEERSAFMFFRAFVPYFYWRVARKKVLNDLEVIRKRYRCWCVGDPHLENFGVLPQFRRHHKRQVLFTMNDPDDGGRGDPALDLLRFMTGIRLAGKQIVAQNTTRRQRLKQVIHAYRQGLEQKEWPTRWQEVRHFLEKRGVDKKNLDEIKKELDAGFAPDPKEWDPKKKQLLRHNISPAKDDALSELEQERIQNTIKDHYGDHYHLRELIQYSKQSGGSGGLVQYRV
ncbi:MAG: DUF2252 family protein, partial [Magnetococcales bacterium]|nr:DUF2252 family protein [Magnetococcales bacterium]